MKKSIVLLVLPAATLLAQQYTISTIAGGGAPPSSVPALSVRLPVSGAVALNKAGEVYFSSGDSVLKVDASGILTRVAGTGQYGFSNDGGGALSAQLAWPAGLVLDDSGNLFISENAAHRIRKVSPGGIISTVAGTGTPGYSGDGGPAATAQLNWPTGLALDRSGNLYIADTGNHIVRRVSSNGTISTVATGLQLAEGVAVDAAGNLYVTDYDVSTDGCGDDTYSGRVLQVSADGTSITVADSAGQSLMSPRAVSIDAAGNLYVVDMIAGKVLKISSGAIASSVVNPAFAVYACPAYYTNFNTSPLICPAGVAVDNAGNLYVSDTGHGRLAKISPQGGIANIVGDGIPGNYWGDGGKATDAALSVPLGVAVDGAGNLYISDTQNSRVRKVTPDGAISTVAGNGTPGYAGDGGPATSAQLNGPAGLAVDSLGNLYIADYLNNRIRKVSTDGKISTVAGRGDTNPPLGDGGPATNASLAGPLGVAVDANGNLYIADTSFYLIRKVSPAGIITTAAGRNFYGGLNNIGFPTGVATDAGGNLYVVTEGRIRRLSPDGTLSTVAGNGVTGVASGDGGPATAAALQSPFAVAVDTGGNLYISGGNLSGYFGGGPGRVREVTAPGIISTIAGTGNPGYSGDGGPAAKAAFSQAAAGIAVDASGNIYVADVFNNVIRVLRPSQQ